MRVSERGFEAILFGDFDLVEARREIKLREKTIAFQPVEDRLRVSQATIVTHQVLAMHSLTLPSFFLTHRHSAAQGLSERRITPRFNNFCTSAQFMRRSSG